ncbi:uncharacterized protein LOC130989975 [Salvia miltiorrhiza]|uniref:uncharacterized protein LOC130989975 n=1 Tax=Salvia miltiorrhiza TaxID=226208 RepID=UPI0025ABF2DA|nr:uncharacterized protein LOC130989975 [Salvia miltiorrhiza]
MDFFLRASTVRLISYNDRFLVADADCVGVSHGTDRYARNAVWSVEIVEGKESIRLKSCHGTYLTASGTPVMPGVTGKRVVQTWPCQYDSATEWEPSRDGMEVRLRSNVYGHFLRPNGSLTPWRNAVTHDVPHRSKSREKMLWDVEVVGRCPDQRRAASVRSRSRSRSRDFKKQDNEAGKRDGDGGGGGDGDEGLYDNVQCWWCAPSCLPF